jgi:4-hydroxy 2-oxovalerate aldolase
MVKILDCTLRDGGYYTNWDFNKTVVDQYIQSTNKLPLEYLEIGYRSIPMKGYLGKYFYSPIYELERLRNDSNKKLAIILNEKDICIEHLYNLLDPIIGLIQMIRIAIDPEHLGRAIFLAERIKRLGFEVSFNVMYMSKWGQYSGFESELKNIDDIVDYFYMVDSYGGVYPNDIKDTIKLVRENTSCKLGFHGHNNLELALINTLTAIDEGVDIVDATLLGMGRGAGNLKTELLLSSLNSNKKLDVDFNALGIGVSAFEGLFDKYKWGTNLPYIISGSNSLPQKDVMDWVSSRVYSFNSIIQALQNQKNNLTDNEKLPVFEIERTTKNVIIIGGGSSVPEHIDGLIEWIRTMPELTIIHASSKNAYHFKGLNNNQLFCLVGSEGHRLEKVFEDFGEFKGLCILPSFPRKMGTYIPNQLKNKSFELAKIDFTEKFVDSHTALALQITINLKANSVYLAGYDGYQDTPISQIERDLTDENEYLFQIFNNSYTKLFSITTTAYKNLEFSSIYAHLI